VFGAELDQDALIKQSHALLETLEAHLKDRDWLAGEQATIADIADYTYIAHAPEGNVSLNGYPNVRAWLKRIEALPGFIAMQATAVGMAA
jgi:glutathione S-transferase